MFGGQLAPANHRCLAAECPGPPRWDLAHSDSGWISLGGSASVQAGSAVGAGDGQGWKASCGESATLLLWTPRER